MPSSEQQLPRESTSRPSFSWLSNIKSQKTGIDTENLVKKQCFVDNRNNAVRFSFTGRSFAWTPQPCLQNSSESSLGCLCLLFVNTYYLSQYLEINLGTMRYDLLLSVATDFSPVKTGVIFICISKCGPRSFSG